MARLNLKRMTFRIKDGYAGPGGAGGAVNRTASSDGAVNLMAGYMSGASTMTVDGFTGAVANGDRFTVAGETGSPIHTITAHTETLGATTSITFTPVLAGAVVDDAVISMLGGYASGVSTMLVDGFTGAVVVGETFTVAGETGSPTHSITAHSETLSNTTSITFTPPLAAAVSDNAAVTMLPHGIDVKIGDGNCTYDEKRTIEYTKNRGVIDEVREGDDEPMDVKMDAVWETITSVSGTSVATPTIEEALKRTGPAATWVSSDPDECRPYAVDIELFYDPLCSVKDETILLPDFRYEQLSHDPKAATISITGKCNAKMATVSREA